MLALHWATLQYDISSQVHIYNIMHVVKPSYSPQVVIYCIAGKFGEHLIIVKWLSVYIDIGEV